MNTFIGILLCEPFALILLGALIIPRLYNYFQSENEYYFISREEIWKMINKEYSNKTFFTIETDELYSVAEKIIKKVRRPIKLMKLFLIIMILLTCWVNFSYEEKELLFYLSIFANVGYLIYIYVLEQYSFNEEKSLVKVEYFVKRYLFDYCMRHNLIKDDAELPDEYMLFSKKDVDM